MEWKNLLSLERQVGKEKEPLQFERYPIDEVEKDYQAIISSAAFRSLQDKTQVFPLDKSDFVRTRLTHSMEVSTIARQLGIMITENKTEYLQDESSFKGKPIKDLLSKQMRKELENFEGNAQALRIIGG